MTQKETGLNITHLFFAVLSGVLMTCSFPSAFFKNGSLDWIAWFALVPLLFALKNLSPVEGFKIGLIAGLAHYLTLLYWLIHTMMTYGHLSFYLSVPILILFSLYLSFFTALFSYGVLKICSRPLSLLAVIPIFWISLEYIRSFFLSGFPWELLGYSQFRRLHLIQISDILGVYGVSFAIVYANSVIFLLFLTLTRNRWRKNEISKPLATGAATSLVLILSLMMFYGIQRVKQVDQLISKNAAKSISVVQGNIPQSEKWNPAFQDKTIQKYADLSLSSKKHDPDLVVWPETATPFYLFYAKDLTKKVQKAISETNTHFLIGSPSGFRKNKEVVYFNSAYLISPEGNKLGRYDKVHLVPFGEYVPFGKLLAFIDKMVAGIGDFSPGNKGSVLTFEGCHLGVQICYEIIFPGLSRAFVKNGATMLVNITNDAWFGHTGAPFQHFSMAVFRAVENKRSLARSANTGISGFIDPLGRILGKTPLFKNAELTCRMPVLNMKTLYTRFGDLLAMICMIASVVVILLKKVDNKLL